MQGASSSGNNSRHFGLIIAYVLPGFIALAGIAPLSPAVAAWLRPVQQNNLGLGPPLYAIMGATAAGLILSCFRWFILDHVHQWTGVRHPAWDDRRLGHVLGGFEYLVQNHFRYYEFCANTLLAATFAYLVNRTVGTLPLLGAATDLGMAMFVVVLFAASRDALAKYYTRTDRLLGRVVDRERKGQSMYNGNDHGGSSSPSKPQTKPAQAPKAPTEPKPSVSKPPHIQK